MDLLDQYLAAVAAQLPQATRDDIVAELSDTLLSQFEDREQELGRPLDDDEREAILRAMGHPLAVAARYRSGAQVVVGSELFPYWLFAVKVGLAILAAVYALNALVRTMGDAVDFGQSLSQALNGLIGSGLGLIGALTVAAAACEHFGIRPRYLDTWRVRDLGFLRLGDPAVWTAAMSTAAMNTGQRVTKTRSGMHRITRQRGTASAALGSLVAGMVFVLWWLGLLHVPAVISLHRGEPPATVMAAPIWTTLYLPILIYTLVQIAIDGYAVLRPGAVRTLAVLQVPVALAGLALTWIVLQAHAWFTLVDADGTRASVSGGAELLNGSAWSNMAHHGDSLAGIASNLSVILSWTMVAVALSLSVKIVRALWQARP